ncbi:MAG: tetratricopeptide repeat protein, partial [Arenicellales bacterium]
QSCPRLYGLGYTHLFRREYKLAAIAAEQAISINPNYADSYLTLAICRIHEGNPRAALTLVRKAMLINPDFPAAYASILGQSHYFIGEYKQAEVALREAIERNSYLTTAHLFLIASLSKQGLTDEAEWAAEQLKNFTNDFSDEKISGMLPVDDVDDVDDVADVADILQHLRLSSLFNKINFLAWSDCGCLKITGA